MSIDNIQATKYFDEVYSYFGLQAKNRQKCKPLVGVGTKADGGTFIGVFDENNPAAIPITLMVPTTGSGLRWSNETSPGTAVYAIVNLALLDFDTQKEEWKNKNFNFTRKEAADFLVKFMQRVSVYLY